MRTLRKFWWLIPMVPFFLAGGLIVLSVRGQNPPVVYTDTIYASYQFHTLKHPTGLVAAFTSGNFYLFISDSSNNVIRQFVVPSGGTGTLTTIAGNGTAGYVDGPVTSAEFSNPTGLQGGTFIWSEQSTECDPTKCGDPNCRLRSCYPVINHHYTRLYVADSKNYVVRMVCSGDPPVAGACNASIANTVTTVAGNHIQGYADGSSLSAKFSPLLGLSGTTSAPTSSAPFYLADAANNVVRRWDGSNVSTFAGSGTRGLVDGYRTSAQFGTPVTATWDASGNMYVTDTDNQVIRKIDTAGNVTTFAGTGQQQGLVNGSGTQAKFRFPTGIVFNPADNFLYVADPHNNVIRRIDLAGNVSTYAGTGVPGLTNGSLSQAQFYDPTNLVILLGFMYVSDSMNNVIRRIDMSAGIVSTYIS